MIKILVKNAVGKILLKKIKRSSLYKRFIPTSLQIHGRRVWKVMLPTLRHDSRKGRSLFKERYVFFRFNMHRSDLNFMTLQRLMKRFERRYKTVSKLHKNKVVQSLAVVIVNNPKSSQGKFLYSDDAIYAIHSFHVFFKESRDINIPSEANVIRGKFGGVREGHTIISTKRYERKPKFTEKMFGELYQKLEDFINYESETQ